MRSIAKSRAGWLALVALLTGGAFVFGALMNQGGQAQTVPGTVRQSSSAASSGLTVDAEKAVFSATGVDVWLHVSSEDATAGIGGVLPADAELAGKPGMGAGVHADGRTVLRFPPEAWPSAGATAELSVRAVSLLSPDGRQLRVDGNWQLAIQLPQDADAKNARTIRTLPPVVQDVAGSKMVVETLKTASATIVRYALPENVSTFSSPTLRAGSSDLTPVQSREEPGREGTREVWFESTPDNVPLVLVFEHLAISDPASRPSNLKVTLAPFQPPAATRPEVVDERELEWKLQADSSSEPPIKRILWRRMPGRTEMEVTIDGMWNPLAGGVPTVLADGVELKVLGVGTYPAFGERGDETRIAIRLNSEAIPRTLVLMDGGGRTTMLPLLEVPLQ